VLSHGPTRARDELLVLSGDPIEIARPLRDRAERTIRPPTSKS
jgi:hypothetical protein